MDDNPLRADTVTGTISWRAGPRDLIAAVMLFTEGPDQPYPYIPQDSREEWWDLAKIERDEEMTDPHQIIVEVTLANMPPDITTIFVCGLRSPRPPRPNVRDIQLTICGEIVSIGNSNAQALVFARFDRGPEGWTFTPVARNLHTKEHSGWLSAWEVVVRELL